MWCLLIFCFLLLLLLSKILSLDLLLLVFLALDCRDWDDHTFEFLVITLPVGLLRCYSFVDGGCITMRIILTRPALLVAILGNVLGGILVALESVDDSLSLAGGLRHLLQSALLLLFQGCRCYHILLADCFKIALFAERLRLGVSNKVAFIMWALIHSNTRWRYQRWLVVYILTCNRIRLMKLFVFRQ